MSTPQGEQPVYFHVLARRNCKIRFLSVASHNRHFHVPSNAKTDTFMGVVAGRVNAKLYLTTVASQISVPVINGPYSLSFKSGT